MQYDETNEGVTFIRDDHAQFFYTIPDGWHRVAAEDGGSGPTSLIASTEPDDPDEERKASVLAGVMREIPSGDDLEKGALMLAKGWAQLSDARSNAVFSQESSRSFTLDGHPAATAALRADFPESDTGSLYLRMTVVEVVEGYYSYLAGTAHPEAADLRAAVDGVHRDLIVVMA